jgi:hypothetical protein
MTLSMPWWNRCSAAADIVVVADTFLLGKAAHTPWGPSYFPRAQREVLLGGLPGGRWSKTHDHIENS